MLTTEEEKFISYWENNRKKQQQIFKQILIGLPIGLLFGLPIILNIFLKWNNQIQVISRGQFNIILICVLLIICFFAIFNTKHKWDVNEQHYKTLLKKKQANS
jgi:glucan phosphoethanolaminetransferase (alkaline phosphatase superfamily)